MSKISKITTSSIQQVKMVKRDICEIRHLPNDISASYNVAKNFAHAKQLTAGRKVVTTATTVLRKGVSPHMPALLAALTSLCPFPGTSLVGYYLGKGLQKLMRVRL